MHPLWWLPDPAAQQDEAYRRIWQNLRSLPEIEDGRTETQGYKAQRAPLAICCVRIPRSAIGPEFDGIRETLGALPFVDVYPDDLLYVTVQEIAYVEDTGEARDEMSRARLNEFVSMAERALRDFPRFSIGLGPVNSFADAAFLDIRDGGWLSRIQGRLMDLMAVSPSTRYPYIPHLTFAGYTEAVPIGNLPATLAEWRDIPLGTFEVTGIEVALVTSGDPFPSLEVIHRFELGTTRATGTIPVRPDLSRE